MVNISNKAKVIIKWNVTPYDYSKEKSNEIQVSFARKYGIPKENVRVSPEFILPKIGNGGTLLSEITTENIQDPEFHKKLFLEYLSVNNINDYDIELIDSIDKDINNKINYFSYEKHRRFSIKWVKWSNFQSYGADNSFDFTSLNGLVLLNGEPANQSGKTTFAVDLLHFLLFGKSEKWDKLEELFNYTLPNETQMFVEGCLCIDGEDYIIKRTLSRPLIEKRTSKSKITHKVEYYRVIGDSVEDLSEYVEENGEDSRQTNKIIKESIGREDDFDLMMCVTGSNLNALINEKPTERGRLLSRWIGLIPIEEKDIIAREKFNQTVKPSLLSNQYNRETLKDEIAAYKTEIDVCKNKVNESESMCKTLENEIKMLEETKKILLSNKQQIDSDVLKIDITTLRNNLETKKKEGIENKAMLEKIRLQISEIGEIEFNVEEYDKLIDKKTKLLIEQQSMRNEAKRLIDLVKHLKTSEFCPTCGKKLDNVDNSKQIKENQEILDKLVIDGKKITQEIDDLEKLIQSQKEKREKYILLNKINTQKSAIEVVNEKLRSECIELMNKEKEYKKNSEAIDKNNNLDISIRNTDTNINSKRETRDLNIRISTQNKANIEEYEKEIKKREEIIEKIGLEEKLVYNWKLYLEMVGKNGISKMVMRNAIPIINARLMQILEDICDFDVNIEINNKNEVTFNILQHGVVKDINSGSGFEKTAAALALRSVLSDISTISRMNFLVLDEILGCVASENYDKMRLLYERISKGYDFVFHITHINDVKDWHNQIITVTKTIEGVSKLKQIQNDSKKQIKQADKKVLNKETKRSTRKKK